VTAQVLNPMYTELSNLYASMQKDSATAASTLKDACQRMGTGKVWAGSAADSWNSSLTGYSGDLGRRVSEALAAVHQALTGTPQKVSPAEATVNSRLLAGRLG
jgi:uncharacterized protein YukE